MIKVRRFLASAAIVGVVAVAFPATAGAGDPELDVDLVSPIAPLTFDATIFGPTCDPGSLEVKTLTLNGVPVKAISITVDPTDPNIALIVLPDDSTPGSLLAVVSCKSGGDDVGSLTNVEEFSTMTVTKVVEGTPPPDTTFLVNFDCVDRSADDVSFDGVSAAELPLDFAVDLKYGATGGPAYVYSDHEVDCTTTEPEDGGALSVVIDPQVLENREPVAYAATVTNTFPIVVEPTFTG